jgi:prepilin-type N-terminal cleavage/methylation domain-containing protein
VRRSGFTLVELLVAMAVIVTLAAIALAIVPDALDQDRTTDGAATVRTQLMMAKARALRDNAPRGVRFLTGTDPTNPAKTNSLWSTEVQQIEQPPPYLVNPNGNTNPGAPYIEFIYTLAPTGGMPPPTPGSIVNRQCFLRNVPATSEPVILIQNDLAQGLYPRLYVSGLGNLYISNLNPGTGELQFNPAPWAMVDAELGAAGSSTPGTGKRYYTFALFMSPRPLLGEPAVPLPKNICVDLPSCLPIGTGTGNYDILFAPNGQVLFPGGTGQIFLWVRDYTKNGGKITGTPSPYPSANFDQGGEQQIVALKTKSGSLGVFPAMFPPYAAGQDEYTFARNSR